MNAIIAALGAALIASPVPNTEQFDLVCQGRRKSSWDGAWKPYELRYRVDLAAKAYCVEDCRSPRPIADVSDVEIAFDQNPSRRISSSVLHRVNRVTGEWKYRLISGNKLVEDAEGQCAPDTFSGIPSAKF